MSGVVSIHDDRDELAGTGVLVTDDLVLTCAHVVNVALGRDPERSDRPEKDSFVTIRFNDAPGCSRKATIDSAPNADSANFADSVKDAWSAPPAQRAKGADICVLRLTKKPPTGATPARIHKHYFATDFPARASGYPDDWNKAAPSPQLDIGQCVVLGTEGHLWQIGADFGSKMAAVLTKSRSAGMIYSGFSGGPLEKHEYLVGLIALARKDPREARAYAIPAVNFPAYVLLAARALSDQSITLANTQVGTATPATVLPASLENASGPTDTDEKRPQLGLVPAEEAVTAELISAYSAIYVGRSEEADRIRALMWSERSGYLFVKGETGAGKSALLVNLVQELRTRDGRPGGPFLIYHFIRQEHGDLPLVLRSLNGQLAKALGDSSFVAALNLEDQFKTLWSRLMLYCNRDRPVLLVIDALDELEEPDSLGRWLPGHLVPYAHVVASERTTFDPLRHLPSIHVARSAAPPLTLGPLEQKDVAELLEQQLHDPAAATRLVEPVLRLTKGFALTTRLLAKDIAENGEATLQDEERLAALMRDYLGEEARQLTQSPTESLRRRLLAVLTEARGPLNLEDLSGILRLNQRDIEPALQPVLRCLASPTSLQFMHPELKRAVAERLTAEEKNAASAAFSLWMESAAKSGTAAIPVYVLENFVDQFRTTRDLKALTSTIVNEQWCTSRYAQRGSHLDYINDLDRLREQAVNSGPDWPALCQTSYVRSQLHTVAANIPSAVLLLLADLGRIDEAVDYAMLQPDLDSRVWVLARLSYRYRERGDLDKAAKTLARAEATLGQIASASKLCALLATLASSFKDAGDLSSAKKLAKYCRDTVSLVDSPYNYEHAEALEAAIDASADVGDFDEAIELVQLKEYDFDSSERLKRIVVPLTKGGAFERLLEWMSKYKRTMFIKDAIGKTVLILTSAGFVREAKELAGLIRDYPFDGLVNMCESLVRQGDIEGCLSTLGQIGLRSKSQLIADLTGYRRLLSRWNICVDLVLRHTALERYEPMATAGRSLALDRILKWLSGEVAAAKAPPIARRLIALVALDSGMSSLEARAKLVGWLVECGAADAAVEFAPEVRSKAAASDGLPLERRRRARGIASSALGKVGKWDEAFAVLEPLLAEDSTAETDQSDPADETRRSASEALARCRKYDEALALCEQIRSPAWRAWALGEVGAELAYIDSARAKEITFKAMDLADRLKADEGYADAHKVIAFACADRGLVEQALAAASALEESERKNALRRVVYGLLAAGNIDGAETAALAISDWGVRHSQLLQVMRNLLKSQQYERAFATATKDPYERYRFDALLDWMDVALAKRPPFERNRWVEKAIAEAEHNIAASAMEFRGRLARAVMNTGDRDKAEEIIDNTLALARGKPVDLGPITVRLAYACVDVHPEDARSIVSRRLTDKSSTKDAAVLLAQLGDWDQVALKIAQTDTTARVKLLAAIGEMAAKSGANDKASEFLEQLDNCLFDVPYAERPGALTEGARLHLLLEDEERAAELCRKAYEQMVSSGSAANLETWAEPIARAGQNDLALQCLAGTSESTRSWWHGRVALALAESGVRDVAIDIAQAVVANASADQEFAKQWCSKALATAGRPDLAQQVALRLGGPGYRVDALMHLARVHQQAGRAQESEDMLLQALAAIPTAEAFPSTRAAAAAMLFRLGHRELARNELVAALTHAVGAGVDAFLSTVDAGAPVVAADLRDGEVWDFIQGLERAATVVRGSQVRSTAPEAA